MKVSDMEPFFDRLQGLNDLICGLRESAEYSKVSPFALGSLSDLLDGITRDLKEKFEGGSPRKEEAQT